MTTNPNYKLIIGLEVHIQSKTKSKMFCSCSTGYFGAAPNTHTCPVCLALPGALPVANRKAIDNCIKLALALNCEINQKTKFDRKNYFYPDLPKGYQISQYDLPIGKLGYIEITGGETDDDKKRIRITRVHQEEDTAKSIHTADGSVIDCNKAGVPLIEVVTEPDFDSPKEVLEFARKLQQLVRYLDVSDANMEMGQMRFELNISVKPNELEGLPDYKVEVKNISSISILEKVIEFEYERQSNLLANGEKPIQETRGIDDKTGETFTQRVKESAEDYRYFPDPDLPLISISDEWLNNIKSSIGELPDQKLTRYISNFALVPETAETIISDLDKVRFFEKAISNNESNLDFVRQVANFLVGDISSLLKKKSLDLTSMKLSPELFSKIISLLLENKISGATVKKLLEEFFVADVGSDFDIMKYVEEHDLIQISDESIIKPIVEEILAANEKIVTDYKSGKLAAKGSLVGQIMGKFKGKANPQVIDRIVDDLLK